MTGGLASIPTVRSTTATRSPIQSTLLPTSTTVPFICRTTPTSSASASFEAPCCSSFSRRVFLFEDTVA